MRELPEKFVEMLSRLPGYGDVAGLMSTTESPVSIRLNPGKPPVEFATTDGISGHRFKTERVPWEPLGFYLAERPAFTFMPPLYDGRFYVQDASSMIIGEIIRRLTADRKEPLRYLDACAAPGGKTTAALANLPEESFVVANEFSGDRLPGLIDNLNRWGNPRFAVSHNDARHLDKVGEVFDIVSADVPCSGEGMMRKNEIAVTQWSSRLIEECARLQREIVGSVWRTLKPGGYLIYSTCTINRTENEENVEWCKQETGAEYVDLGLDSYPGVMPGIDTDAYCARFAPGIVKGEGLFVAVLRKPGSSEETKRQTLSKSKAKAVQLPAWINPGFMGVTNKNGDIFAIPEKHFDFIAQIGKSLNLVSPGTAAAVIKGREAAPAHAVATSSALKKDFLPSVTVDYNEAIAYLRGEALRLGNDLQKGYALIKHVESNLGWVKNIGNRANNLLPAGCRIRSTQMPEKVPTLFGG